MFQTKVVQKIKTHILFSVTDFFNKRDLYEKRIVERDGPQMTIWRMRIACWIIKSLITHTQVL